MRLTLQVIYKSNLGLDQTRELSNEKEITIFFAKIISINFYFLSSEEFENVPLTIRITPFEQKTTEYSYIWIIVISILIPLILGIFTICFKICSRRRLIPSRQRPEIIQSNQVILELNNANISNNNVAIFEEYCKNELKPLQYKKGMNIFGEDCGICIEPLIENISNVIKLPCNHFFHEKCIKDWIQTNVAFPKCPYCNDNILEHLEKAKKENLANKIIEKI